LRGRAGEIKFFVQLRRRLEFAFDLLDQLVGGDGRRLGLGELAEIHRQIIMAGADFGSRASNWRQAAMPVWASAARWVSLVANSAQSKLARANCQAAAELPGAD
jgi:hypothetical protein